MLINPDCIELLHQDGIRNTHPATPLPGAAKRMDHQPDTLPDHFVTQGLFDLQINGFAGVDYNDPEALPEHIEASMLAMLATGVTRCLPTVITADFAWQSRCFATLESARNGFPVANAMIAGYHLEGPFMSPEPGYCGCHPAEFMRPGDIDYFERLQACANGQIRLVTVAPERPGVLDLIPLLIRRGVTVAIGHSAADHETIARAVDAGASVSTHLGNGVASPLAKGDNVILSQLANDSLTASFIADGVHLRRHVLGIYLRAKTPERTVLVTDGTAGSGGKPGTYTLGKMKIERQQQPIVYLPGTTSLAGSATTLDECVRNVISWYGIPMDMAVGWAGASARLLIGLPSEPASGEAVEWVWWKNTRQGPYVEQVQLHNTRIGTMSMA
ncbi:MAG: N-acetylglucosamine-6-phosphate deacetylase [Granulosicoccus sp.]|nr:N-acetylglucosamine-6-phosphate deacetylase [Granulosicoccus sp.]